MSRKLFSKYVCELCGTERVTEGVRPNTWAEWSLKAINGLAYECTFHSCGACMGTETNKSGSSVAYDTKKTFQAAFKRLFRREPKP
jgi:hypothetical protein